MQIDYNTNNTLTVRWNIYDIILRAKKHDIKLTEQQGKDILYNLHEQYDLDVGINMTVIDCGIQDCKDKQAFEDCIIGFKNEKTNR